MSKVSELREERGRLQNELSQVLAGQDSAESREKAKKIIARMDEAKAEIDKLESRGLSTVGEGLAKDKDIEMRRAFQTYLRQGERTSPEMRALLSERRDIGEGNTAAHIGTYADMGFFVPTGFVYDVEVATKYYADLLTVFGSLDTASGNPIPYPVSNDTNQQAVALGEAGVVTEKDVTASQITFNAFKYSSGLVKASVELVQDSAFNIEAFVAKQMGIRFGRKWESVLTNGTGSGEPTGLLTAIAASGATPVTAVGANANSGNTGDNATNSIGTDDLISLEHSVDKSYRRNGSYMLHDQTVATLRKLKDKFGRPIWVDGIEAGESDRLNGKPVVINNGMPVVGPSNVVIAFGDMSKMLVRRVKDFQILVLRERYAEAGQIAYLGFARIDSNLLDAGTHPVNVLQMHS
jgi:HK97 family phage major capsid protein